MRTTMLLLGVLALVGAACAKDEETGESAMPAGMKDTEACSTAPGVTDEEITLGALVDLSGPTAAGGVPWTQSLEAFVEYANEELDGIGGRTIRLEVTDTAGDPNVHGAKLQELSEDVLTIALSWGTEPTMVSADTMLDLCMASLVGGYSGVIGEVPGHAIIGPPYALEVLNGVDFVQEQLAGEGATWALATVPGAIAEEARRAMGQAVEEYGIEVAADVEISPADQDISAQVQTLQEAAPDYVMVTALPGQTAQLLARYQGDSQFVLFSPAFVNALLQSENGAVFEGVLVSRGELPWSTDTDGAEIARDYVGDAEDFIPESFHLSGWQVGALVYEALDQALSEDDLTRGGFARALFGIEDFDVADLGRSVTFSASGRPAGIPTLETRVYEVDSEHPDGLEPLTELFAGSAAEKYYERYTDWAPAEEE